MHRAPVIQAETNIDLRPVPPPQRHALVFGLFDTLGIDEALVLVNDHDPRPLHGQLLARHAGTLVWEYLDEGPEIWRVRIGRVAASGCCGGCGGAGH